MKNMAVIKTIKKDGKLKGFLQKINLTLYTHLFIVSCRTGSGFFPPPWNAEQLTRCNTWYY